MPLELNRKAVQTFSGDGSYPTTGDDTKRTSEALIEKYGDSLEWARKFMNDYERRTKVKER